MTEVYEAVTIHEGLAFGEAPRWHDGRLWFSDPLERAMLPGPSCGIGGLT